MRGNWQDFNRHDASRGPSAIAELLVLRAKFESKSNKGSAAQTYLESERTVAVVSGDEVDTSSAVAARLRATLVDVVRAVAAVEAGATLASV